MVKHWKPIWILLITFVLAVSVENEFFLFLLGFEVMVYAASVIQVYFLSKQVQMRIILPNRMAYRGEAYQIQAELINRSRFPIPQVMLRAAIRVFPEREELLIRGKTMLGGHETGRVCFVMDSQHCDCLEIRPNQLMITDYLGLAQRKCTVDTTESHMLFVLPENLKSGISLPDGKGAEYAEDGPEERKGSTALDVSDIRPYQMGDPIKLVHWKLSARLDELMVREMSDPSTQVVRVYLNLCETDEKPNSRLDKEKWDRFMETVAEVSSVLLEREKKHVVIWPDTEHDVLVTKSVDDEESQQLMFCELLRAQTFYAKDYLPLLQEVYSGEAKETTIEIDLQGRISRTAA